MKKISKISLRLVMVMAFIFTIFTSCEFDEVVDPNGPSIGGVESGASIDQLNQLAVGLESTSRNGLGVEVTVSGTMARELYLFDADPGNTGDVLGANGGRLSNSAFYSVSQWNGSYRCIKNANLLIGAVNNTESVTAEEREGYIGFAKTFVAYELIQVLKSYGVARVDVSDPNNLGPVLDFDQAITVVRNLLDEANTNLNNAGSSFAFPLSNGFDGFSTPATFAQFNRAVAAVAAIYDENGSDALTALTASYFDLTGDLELGPKHVFSQSSGDRANPVFRVPSTPTSASNGDQIVVHDSWINEAEAGDTRVTTKAALRTDPSVQDGLTGTHETRLYATNVDPIDIIRNEELILVYAEASILANNLQDAEDALNVIRNAAGLANYSGVQTAAALTTEMLNQRRYSLWSENHRMFDLRRYDLSDTLPLDRAGDQVFNVLPIPLSENQ
ncbi:RagB/SusD family nutrient uptake outer membrane protein [Aquimarina sp. MMG016]|uniref:RagB/SusD family nutrient uptake outer membrane protein n=1 Tax=Aquimarina sp. MMG016 TaxID=2822690 RepID=UPI001B3A719C|nr:RagB/SusD family nutrient uptake outer membrane protein [Aquimarina sp. MMG016]MBQ4818817.1 RagB/SusD family nutrient uptake outer membrane protein [Aquimarina sp. MMG016]